MTVMFTKYGPGEATGEASGCVVSHPDAGGQCPRPAVGEVWSLPFCDLHGHEAELAAQEEMATSLEGIFTGLVAVEQERHDRNERVVEILEEAARGGSFDTLAHGDAIAAAYPPEERAENTDPDTLAYDYKRSGWDTPYEWWCGAQFMACRFMRQAHDAGLAGLLRDLEYVRERATVQRVLAGRDLSRRWTEPRKARREAEAAR